MSTQPGGNIHKQRIYETPGSLTTRECPLHIKIWNAFLQISTLFLEGKVGSGCLEGGQREGGTLHINKPDDPNAGSPQSGARGACPESWVCIRLLGPARALLLLLFFFFSFSSSSSFSSSLLELQGPDMLRPARPAFGFLVVATYCAFQDFVLGRGEARGRKG